MTIQVQGVSVPSLMYGTAWKEEQTRELVLKALNAGFRAIDTANHGHAVVSTSTAPSYGGMPK